MYEGAVEMVGRDDWPYRDARITLRDEGGVTDAVHTLMGTQDPGHQHRRRAQRQSFHPAAERIWRSMGHL